MKTNLLIALAIILTLSWGVGFAQTVVNGNFEAWTADDADNWTKDTGGGIEDSQESGIVHGGTYSSKLTINTQDQGICDYESDLISGITGGNDYTGTVWVYDNDPAGRVTIVLDWFDASDVFLSSNYSNIYSADGTTWEKLEFGIAAPATAAKAKVRLRGYDVVAGWDGDATFYADDASLAAGLPGATDVANIAAARATTGLIRITGTVTLVSDYDGLDTYGHQFAIQDSSGVDGQSGMLVVDSSNVISNSANYLTGYTISNLTGNISVYHGMIQLVLTADPGVPSAGSAPPPLTVPLPVADFNAIEAELIIVNGLSTTSSGIWISNTNYTFSDGSANDIVVRIEDGCDLVGATIPSGAANIIGIAWEYDGTVQIEPRYTSDVIDASGISNWMVY